MQHQQIIRPEDFRDFSAESLRRKVAEKCGVVGVVLGPKTLKELGEHGSTFGARCARSALKALRDRGYDSSGLASSDCGLDLKLAVGLNGHAINLPDAALSAFPGNIVSGHTRYGTSGDKTSLANAQPLSGRAKIGGAELVFAISHNGNLTNTAALSHSLDDEGIHIGDASDTVALAKLVENLSFKNDYKDELSLIKDVVSRIEGSYSIVFHFPDALIAVRDNFCNKPFWLGSYNDSFFVASETVAFDEMVLSEGKAIRPLRELGAGEILVIRPGEEPSSHFLDGELDPLKHARCMLDLVYLERPESSELGGTVWELRQSLGGLLAKEFDPELIKRASYVAGVPSGGIPAAKGFSEESGIPFIDLLEIDPAFTEAQGGMHRTFILPSEAARKLAAAQKHRLIESAANNVAGKEIILIDDSLVRANAFKKLEPLLLNLKGRMVLGSGQENSSTKIHLGIILPPVLYACYWGVSIPPDDKLIARIYPNPEELARYLNVESITYLSVGAIEGWARMMGTGVCLHCVTGEAKMPMPND